MVCMKPSRRKSSHKLHPTVHESSEAEVACSAFPVKVEGRDKCTKSPRNKDTQSVTQRS